MKKLAIFDLDGTLVNTIEDVCCCFNEALKRCSFPVRDDGFIASLVGKPLETIVCGLLPEDADEDTVTRVAKTYREVYGASEKPNTKPYPGVVEMLHKLQSDGIALAVNSNKPHEAAVDVVAQMFPGLDMSVSGYGNVLSTKPDPEGAELLMREAGVTLQETVYVGDTVVDVDTAANAGIDCIIVTWGQGTPELYEDSRIAKTVGTAADLVVTIKGL